MPQATGGADTGRDAGKRTTYADKGAAGEVSAQLSLGAARLPRRHFAPTSPSAQTRAGCEGRRFSSAFAVGGITAVGKARRPVLEAATARQKVRRVARSAHGRAEQIARCER